MKRFCDKEPQQVWEYVHDGVAHHTRPKQKFYKKYFSFKTFHSTWEVKVQLLMSISVLQVQCCRRIWKVAELEAKAMIV